MNKVWVFFYGTFMSARVLRQHGIECNATHPARVSGYLLSIRPRVNLTQNRGSCVYGGMAFVSQNDIAALYDGLKEQFGIIYQPYPVMAELSDGSIRAALCFISSIITDDAPDNGYIDEMMICAREMHAPEIYLSHIDAFRTKAEQAHVPDAQGRTGDA